MKRIVILTMLLIGCSEPVEEKVKTFYLIDPNVIEYVLEYERDVKSIGLNLQNKNISFSVMLGKLPRNIAGMAIGMFNEYAVNIILDVDLWHSLSRAEKKALVYHELSHDVFGLHHNTCDLMSGSLRAITDEMVKELLDTLTKQQNK